MRPIISVFAAALCLAAASVDRAGAQAAPDFTAFLAGPARPLTLTFKDLTPLYRRLDATPSNDAFATYLRLLADARGARVGLYYTRGETLAIADETYLVAYQPQAASPSYVLRNYRGGLAGMPARFPPNTKLTLSLLSLRTAGNLSDIAPYDPKRDMMSPAETGVASLANLAALGTGMRDKISNNFGVVPRIDKTPAPEMRRAFYPGDESVWRDPATDQYYVLNPAISGLELDRVANARYLPAFYESAPASDGTRGVLFLDGHVERVSPARWSRVSALRPRAKVPQMPVILLGPDTVTPAVKKVLSAAGLNRISVLKTAYVPVGRKWTRANGVSTRPALRQVIILIGDVRTASQKHQAAVLAAKHAPGMAIDNRLRVVHY